jgi:hypothetical protein
MTALLALLVLAAPGDNGGEYDLSKMQTTMDEMHM